MNSFKRLLVLMAALVTGACAHPMNIKPDVDSLTAVEGRIQKNVGLYISPEHRNQEVTSPGGGGDKVSYHPYTDKETGLYKALGNVFQSVTVLSAVNDKATIDQHSIKYVVEPQITATSSSSGVFTWMATDFTVAIVCKVSDSSGNLVTNVSATGTGTADSGEVRKDFSIAGERAAKDALQKLEGAFLAAPELKQ
jgi:hypothetical protein